MNTNKHYLKRTLWISSIMLTGLIAGCNSGSDSSTENSGSTVISTNPADGDKAAPLNHKVIATFSEAMDATTIDTQSFSVKDAGGAALSGVINVDAASHSASFTPAGSGFAAGTDYTATLTTAIKSTAGSIALANNYVWHFTSGTAADIAVPSVTSTNPVAGATGVVLNRAVTANISEALDPATVNAATFTISPAVSGVVSYSDKEATFTPSSNLAIDTTYTVTLTAGIKDLADNALTAKSWSFMTGSTIAQGPA
ncbi:MAG TPA: Ig-like domain-containing protein, partial [Psychromonas sp.]